MDTDATGYLDLKEFKIGASRLGLPFATTEEAEREFAKLDSGKGRVTEDDFIRWFQEHHNDELRKKMLSKFKPRYDKVKKSSGVLFG